jgi:hypothetical protein
MVLTVPATPCGLNDENETEKEPEIITIHWMDPEIWGFKAWSFLFSTLETLKQNFDQNIEKWQRFLRILPKVLPCFTCKQCCAKFMLERSPPTTSLEDCQKWLCDLRRDVRRRNAQQPITQENIKLGFWSPTQDDEAMTYGFLKRLQFKPLFLMDAFVFLASVIMTGEYETKQGLQNILEFVECVKDIAPVPLSLEPIQKPFQNAKDGLNWLKSSKLCPSYLGATLKHMPLHSRKVKRVCKV